MAPQTLRPADSLLEPARLLWRIMCTFRDICRPQFSCSTAMLAPPQCRARRVLLEKPQPECGLADDDGRIRLCGSGWLTAARSSSLVASQVDPMEPRRSARSACRQAA